MERREWTYDCHICKKKGLTYEQMESGDLNGWVVETDPPYEPGGYSVFRVYCPSCYERKLSRKILKSLDDNGLELYYPESIK